jgi:hypothetical protein
VKLDLNALVFAGSTTSLLPNWQAQVRTLIKTLDTEPSTLRLTYYLNGESDVLASQRLNAVQNLIAKMWKQDGDRYKLPIETRVVGVEGVPSK